MPDNEPNEHPSGSADLPADICLMAADVRVPPSQLAVTLASYMPGTRCDVLLRMAERSSLELLLTTAAPTAPRPPESALAAETAYLAWLRERGFATIETVRIAYGDVPLGVVVLARTTGAIARSLATAARQLARAIALRHEARRRESELREVRAAMMGATARAAVTRQLWRQAMLAVGSVHNLGNILGLMSGLAEIAEPQAPPALRGDLEQIMQAAADGGRIVRRVLAREDPEQAGGPRVAVLNRVIYEVVTLTRPIWGANDAIAVKIDGAVPAIALADPADVREVLVNLVLNAVAAMPQGGEITFSCHSNEREVILEVADTGIGIAPEDLEAIFEPGRTSRPGGMGLGLPTSRSLIEQAGGRLTVKSEPGRGATFTIALPRAAQIELAGGVSTRTGPETQARRGSGQHP